MFVFLAANHGLWSNMRSSSWIPAPETENSQEWRLRNSGSWLCAWMGNSRTRSVGSVHDSSHQKDLRRTLRPLLTRLSILWIRFSMMLRIEFGRVEKGCVVFVPSSDHAGHRSITSLEPLSTRRPATHLANAASFHSKTAIIVLKSI